MIFILTITMENKINQSQKLKKFLLTLFSFFFIINFCSLGEGKIYNHIVAIVNDEIVMQTELQRALEVFKYEMSQSSLSSYLEPNQLDKAVLQSLVDKKLQLQEAINMNISVDFEEITRGIQQIKHQNNLTNNEELEKILQTQNMSIEDFQEKLKENILLLKFREKAIGTKIQLTEEEITSYFENHKKKQKTGIHLSHIFFLIPEDADEKSINDILIKANTAWEELKEGKDFAEAAGEYSQDPDTAQTGGDLGYLELESIALPLKEELQKLQVGQFSPPIRTSFGFHIIKYLGQASAVLEKNSPLWHKIKETLVAEKTEKYAQQFLEQLRERSYIKIYPPD